jgi:hypothetical protein
VDESKVVLLGKRKAKFSVVAEISYGNGKKKKKDEER